MGTKYEVWAWVPGLGDVGSGYGYEQVWGGESLIRALIEAAKAKRIAGCVKLEWRS